MGEQGGHRAERILREMRPLLFAALLLLTVQFTTAAPLEDPDSTVPEEVLTEYAKHDPWDVIDDPEDAEAEKHPPVDPLGNNVITGQPVTSKDNGMDNSDHLYPMGGRKYVKNPGYTPADSSMENGHYYLGSGRRRIGAGFGRRRRVTEIPMSKASAAAQKKQVDAMFKGKGMKALLKFAHQRMSSYSKGKPQKMTKKQLEQFKRELFGMTHGPTFFESANYKGDKLVARSSVGDLDKTGKLQNNDMSSLKVLVGWKVKLYTKKHFRGQSLEIKGPTNLWSLSKKPLTVHGGFVDGGGGGKMTVYQGVSDFHTTWDNQVASIKITKYEFIAPLVTKPCTKSCGIDKYEITGKVFCRRSGGLQKKATVPDSDCAAVKLSKPKIPKKRCPGTPACVTYKTSKPTGTCYKKCGFAGNTLYGKVWCEIRARNKKDGKVPPPASVSKVKVGTHVKDKKCVGQSVKKPPKPSKKCPATKRCVKWTTKFPKSCPKACGKGSSKIASVNTCKAVAGGQKVSAQECKNWKLTAPGTKYKHCPATAPCPTPAPTPAPAVKKTCKVSSIKGFSTYAWDPRGRYCYHVILGTAVRQDWSHKKSRCNAGQFKSDVTIGRYKTSHNYPNGDSRSCPGGKKRSVTVQVKQDPSVSHTIAKVTEPRVCEYAMVVTRKSCP